MREEIEGKTRGVLDEGEGAVSEEGKFEGRE